MGQIVEFSPNRTISMSSVKTGHEVAIENNTVYTPGEKFSLRLLPATTQMVWQVETTTDCGGKPAYFEKGACEGQTRTLDKKPVLVMPESENCIVKVVSGWATSYKSGVKLSAEFIFGASGEGRVEAKDGEISVSEL